MQREENALVVLFCIAMGISISVVLISLVRCSSAADVAQRHESEVISKCQLVANSLYIDCLKREWDRIHEENK